LLIPYIESQWNYFDSIKAFQFFFKC